MTELSEFDPSIQHTSFQEPLPASSRVTSTTNASSIKYTTADEEADYSARQNRRQSKYSQVALVLKTILEHSMVSLLFQTK